MSQASTIAAADYGNGTPVTHNFAPAKLTADMALFEDRASGIYIGFNKLTFMLSRPTGASDGRRNLSLKIKLETPKLETLSNNTSTGIAPAPTVAYRPVVDVTVTLPERCTLADRQDLRAMLINVLAGDASRDAFEKYELPF